MHEDLRNIPQHMQRLGRSSLAHALTLEVSGHHGNTDYGYYQRELGVLVAAHAAEILLKARIAEEHPLLIFSQIPKSKNDALLEISALFEKGRTIQYQDIPERLWATTGYKLKNLDLYKQFGDLRNNIQHFVPSESQSNLRYATLEFIFRVIDPFLQDFWGGYAVTCIEYPEYSTKHQELIEALFSWGIDFDYPEDEEYKELVQRVGDQANKLPNRRRDILDRADKYNNHIMPRLWSSKPLDVSSEE